jgi:hypothetical protein
MMRRLFALGTAAVIAAALAGTAHATHGGAEHRAVGHGAAAADETTSVTLLTPCLGFTGAITLQPTPTVTTRSQISETFDFDSRLTTEEAEDVLLSEPHGHMRIAYAETVTTTLTFNIPPGQLFCFFGNNLPQPGTTSRSATATADVTCLRVVGSRAAIGGHITRWEGDFPPTRGVLFNATDNTVAGQQLARDQFAASFVAETPQVCPAPSADHPITEGDVSVHES